MATATRKAPAKRKASTPRRKVRHISWLDRLLRTLPFSEEDIQRVFTWAFILGLAVLALAAAQYFGLTAAAYQQYAQLAARAGFQVQRVEITGMERVDQLKVYELVLAEKDRAMPLVDIDKVRSDLLEYGWIEDARVSRRLPDTLAVEIIERKPAAVWQRGGKYSLIDAKGHVLENVSAGEGSDLPVLNGADANRHTVALNELLDKASALKTQVAGASWIGNRRWDLRFKSGETLALPEGEKAAAEALLNFARMDGIHRLLGRDLIHFDLRDPERAYFRKAPKPEAEKADKSDQSKKRRDGRMKAARVEKLISAIDIGSSKVSALIAGQTDSGELLVLGTGQRESRGVTRGCIADVEQAELSVRHAVEQAERLAGTNIDRVWVGISAGGLDSMLAPVEIELGGDRITQDDIDQLLQAGRANIHTGGKMPLHIRPTLYSLDGVGGVANPLGLHADRLGVDIHVVLADQSPVRNIDMTARAAHLDVESIVVAPVATGLACLTAEERDLGVALVELGASITNVSVFIGGMLVGLATIPKGASDITDDIASTFGIRRAQAERLKCFHGSALTSPRDHQEVLDVAPDDAGAETAAHAPRITKAQLNGVVCQRVDGIVSEIGRALKELGFSGPSSHQVVLTGGGAELKGLAEHMQGALGRTVRIGRPSGLSGIPEAHAGPAFSTLVGLIHYAASDRVDLKSGYDARGEYMAGAMPGLFERIKRAIRENF